MMSDLLTTLHQGIVRLNEATFDELKDTGWLLNVIRRVGLAYDPIRNEGNEGWQLSGQESVVGLAQIPEQLAPALVFLCNKGIKHIIEVGTYSGWHACFLAAYFRRFEPSARVTTIDRRGEWSASVRADRFLSRLPVSFRCFDTAKDEPPPDLVLPRADLCIIDAGHEYSEAKRDWELFGRSSKRAFFHDINDEPLNLRYESRNERTVGHLWKELVAEPTLKTTTFVDHASRKPLMGIGLVWREDGE